MESPEPCAIQKEKIEHPVPSAIRKVCRVLETMYPYERREGSGVDMSVIYISRPLPDIMMQTSSGEPVTMKRNHKCGTIHGFAGWYWLGCFWDGKKEYLEKCISFRHAQAKLNQALGWPGFHFDHWASANPKLWGNEYGDRLYCHKSAFGVDDDDEITLKKIVTYLQGVADRIEKERENGASGTK